MRLGLSTRKVAELSLMVAAEQGSSDFAISHARMVQIENEQSIPGIQKLFTLSCIYGVAVQELFSAYFNLGTAEKLHVSMPLPNTHLAAFADNGKPNLPFPVPFRSLARSVITDVPSDSGTWGREWSVPPAQGLNRPESFYGLIGLSDHTMNPLIPPGSVVQIEACRRIAKDLPYRSELERPIYFLESRSGHLCCWCSIHDGRLISLPHPLSPCRPQIFDFPSEVEVVGRVTGVAPGGTDSRFAGWGAAKLNQMETRLVGVKELQPDNSSA